MRILVMAFARMAGIDKPTSRESGIMTGDRLEKVKEWIKQDMGTAFDPLYGAAIDCLERVTVRASTVHGDSTLVSGCCTHPVLSIGGLPKSSA